MAAKSPFERYVALGMEFTQMTRRRAESIVRDLVKEGELGRDHAEDWADELLERSRKSAELFSELVRAEVRRQVKSMGLTSSQDIVRLVQDLVVRFGAAGRAGSTPPAPGRSAAYAPAPSANKAAPARKTAAKKAAPARKTVAKKAVSARKAAVKKAAPARKTVAKKAAPARKTVAKKAVPATAANKAATARKSAVKKAVPRA